jgi:hypothetical protein
MENFEDILNSGVRTASRISSTEKRKEKQNERENSPYGKSGIDF